MPAAEFIYSIICIHISVTREHGLLIQPTTESLFLSVHLDMLDDYYTKKHIKSASGCSTVAWRPPLLLASGSLGSQFEAIAAATVGWIISEEWKLHTRKGDFMTSLDAAQRGNIQRPAVVLSQVSRSNRWETLKVWNRSYLQSDKGFFSFIQLAVCNAHYNFIVRGILKHMTGTYMSYYFPLVCRKTWTWRKSPRFLMRWFEARV